MAKKKPNRTKRPVTINIDPRVYLALCTVSGAQGRSNSEVIEEALRGYLPGQKIPEDVQQILDAG